MMKMAERVYGAAEASLSCYIASAMVSQLAKVDYTRLTSSSLEQNVLSAFALVILPLSLVSLSNGLTDLLTGSHNKVYVLILESL
jgi:hypothetical protein